MSLAVGASASVSDGYRMANGIRRNVYSCKQKSIRGQVRRMVAIVIVSDHYPVAPDMYRVFTGLHRNFPNVLQERASHRKVAPKNWLAHSI